MRSERGCSAAWERGGTADPGTFLGSSSTHSTAPLPAPTPAWLSTGWVCFGAEISPFQASPGP